MRGHGALLGVVDTTVHITKTSTGRLAEVVKSSDHEEGQRVAFSLKSVTIGQDEHGDPITAPVVIEQAMQPGRLAFERATIALAAAKFIGVWEPYVWIT